MEEIESPAILDGRREILFEYPEVYARIISGYIGVSDDFDLMGGLANANYSWRRYIEAEKFFGRVKNVRGLAAHIEICNAVMAGRSEKLAMVKESPIIDIDILSALSDRSASALSLAANELIEKGMTADIRATLIYADMIAALAVRTENIDSREAQFLQDNIFTTAWLELLEGVSFEQFADRVRKGKHSYRQTVIMDFVVSLVSHASDFWENRDKTESGTDWTARRNDLLSLLVDENIITEAWANGLKQNKAVVSIRTHSAGTLETL